MSDLIEQLRTTACENCRGMREIAVDEIERLTAENMELHADAMEFDEKLTKVAILRLDLETENIRLRAALEKIASCEYPYSDTLAAADEASQVAREALKDD